MSQPVAALLWLCLSLLLLLLVGETCFPIPPRRQKLLVYHSHRAVPLPLQPTQDQGEINCLIDLCYLSLDHPQLCENTLNAIRSRNAMEPCNDTCAANATGAECLHPTVMMYLLQHYDGLSCGQQWESSFWGVDPKTATFATLSPTTPTWTPTPPRPSAQTSSHPDLDSLRLSKNLRGYNDATSAPTKQPHSSAISDGQINPKYESPSKTINSIEKTRGPHVPDSVALWLKMHGKRPLLQLTGNIDNQRRLLKQAGIRGSVAPPPQPSSPFILGQHFWSLIISTTSATRNPPATQQPPPTRDRNGDDVLTLLADRETERHFQPQEGEVSSVSRLCNKDEQKIPLNGPPSSGGRTHKSTKEKIFCTESQLSLNTPSTTVGKNDELWAEYQPSQLMKKTRHHTNVFINNIHTGQQEGGGHGLMLWLITSVLVVVVVVACCGFVILICAALNNARKRSYTLQ